jgi:hypothetical protein
MSTFSKGQILTAKSNAQGLVKGRKYVVLAVLSTVHGFFLYEVHGLEGTGNSVLRIANAPFVLAA